MANGQGGGARNAPPCCKDHQGPPRSTPTITGPRILRVPRMLESSSSDSCQGAPAHTRDDSSDPITWEANSRATNLTVCQLPVHGIDGFIVELYRLPDLGSGCQFRTESSCFTDDVCTPLHHSAGYALSCAHLRITAIVIGGILRQAPISA